MINIIQSGIIAISMYSKIPMPRIEWKEENMKYAMCFFPVVGIVIGILQYLAGRVLSGTACGSFFFASVMTLLPVLVSGGIHLDGFMDTMDALSSWGDREKKLAILKDSHSGAFAILGLCCYFIWNLAVWSEMGCQVPETAGCIYVVSRSLSGFAVVTIPAAKKSGLVRTFQDGAQKKAVRITMVIFLVLTAALMFWLNAVQAAAALICAAAVFIYYWHMSRKQFGGVTGDLAGYFLQMCELAMLTGILVSGSVSV